MRDLSRDLESLRIERSEPPRRRLRGKWTIVLGALVLASLAVAAQQLSSRLSRPVVSISEVTLVSPAQADVKLVATGYVVPMRKAVVASKQPGRLEAILVKEGDEVRQGQLLATLESADLRATVNDARAALASARAKAKAAAATLADTKLQLDREKRLLGSGASTQASVDSAQSRYEVAAATLAASEAEVESAAARVRNAEAALSNARITAPFDGTVVRKIAEVGEVPTAIYQSSAGGIVELVDFSSLVVEADVSENRIGAVTVNAPAEIVLDAFPGQRFRGEVSELRPTIDRQKATVLTRVKFVDPVPGVFPQMAAKVSFLSRPLDPEKLKEPAKRVVPASAVVVLGDARAIFVFSEGRVHSTAVVLGEPLGEAIELKEGPPPGTRIIAHPPPSLRDGQAVKEKS